MCKMQEDRRAPAPPPSPSPTLPLPYTPPPPAQALPDKGLQVSLLFSPSSIKGSPPGGSPGGLGLEKGTRRRGLELRPGPSSSLLSGLEGPLDGLSPHGPPGCPRQLGPAPTRAGPCPKADTSPGCSVSVGNREHASEKGENREGTRGAELAWRGAGYICSGFVFPPSTCLSPPLRSWLISTRGGTAEFWSSGSL